MKRFIYYSVALLTMVCAMACKKDEPGPGPGPEPEPALSLDNFKPLAAGFYPSSSVMRTDPITGNIWILTFREQSRGQVPFMQCYNSYFDSIGGYWQFMTDQQCPENIPASDFAILPDGSALCVFGQRATDKITLGYYNIIKPDNTVVNKEGTLIYDVRNDFPELAGCTAECHVLADGEGGAWIAVSYQEMIVVRHFLSSNKMSDAVKIIPANPEMSVKNINMMLAEDGGIFLTEMEMKNARKEEEHIAHWVGHGNLVKIDAKCASCQVTPINSDEDCNASTQMRLVPDTKGGAYMIYISQKPDHEEVACSHFDENGKFGALKPVVKTDDYVGCHFAVVPSDNSLCLALNETVSEIVQGISVVVGYKISLVKADENISIQYDDLTLREFDSPDAKVMDVTIAARKDSTMDVCYLFHDTNNKSPYYNIGVGSVNFSDMSIDPEIVKTGLIITDSRINYIGGPKEYVNGKINLGWACGATEEMCAGQVVLQ